MTLTIDLTPELELELQTEAARTGQAAADLARALLEAQLRAARQDRSRRVAALLDTWDAEDTQNPDPDPVPTITPLSLGRVPVE